ncbi:MAG: HlyD family efflux transporter periplasmic adaptor subunit [Bacteroidota bacterium]|nr:HlyD family efflux transporter periplasmic adaptor subunit [Bacteroidota bacterium]
MLLACGKSNADADASGTFESTEVIVSAEATGEILSFNIQEGQSLTANELVGIIDTTQLYLRKQQIVYSKKSLLSRRPDIKKQIAALKQQIATAKTERRRFENLVKANAANQKQVDDINAQIAVLEKQLDAQQTTLVTGNQGINEDSESISLQIAQLEDQLHKCRIVSPITGTVLVKYAEMGEVAAPGKALFKIADINNMILRAYVTADQLTQLKIGQKVKVTSDFGKDKNREYAGTIAWISDKAEFTPKTIQTRDERANLVYAVKINVKNDGLLKIGMYGDVKFK